jgi:hypothetical protein
VCTSVQDRFGDAIIGTVRFDWEVAERAAAKPPVTGSAFQRVDLRVWVQLLTPGT